MQLTLSEKDYDRSLARIQADFVRHYHERCEQAAQSGMPAPDRDLALQEYTLIRLSRLEVVLQYISQQLGESLSNRKVSDLLDVPPGAIFFTP